ncbi:MAG TPA: serine hydrolase [Verrucomicrobiae bacterium]
MTLTPRLPSCRPHALADWRRRPLPSVLLNATFLFVALQIAPRLAVGAESVADDFWRQGSPESQGFSAAKLEALRAGLAARNTKALLVIRNDTIVCEWYAPGQDRHTKFGTASLAKALVGGVSFAVAMTDGRIGLDDRATSFIPQWRDDPRKSRITLRQLGSHTSGIDDAEADNKPHDQLTGWKGDFWKHLAVPDDPFTLSRDRAPLIFEPGVEMRYSNPGIALLTYCVTASLKDGAQKDVRSLLRERVLRPIGVPDAEWSAGYGKTSTVDGLPLVGSWGGGAFTARAAAGVGRLMLRGGDWNGQRILSAEAVRLTTSDAGTPGPCGIGWWSNNEGDCAKLPRDAFFGSGAGHQILLVVPSFKLIVARFGGTLAETGHNPKAFHEPYRLYLFEPLMAAVAAGQAEAAPGRNPSATVAPCPPSPVIARLEWAPKETIIRRAPGSDNWPLTWADDDALYGAYGDGNGFAPFTSQKLSMGFARITRGPLDPAGANIASPGESLGEGPRGKKASGILCLEGVLYLLARNVGNSLLGWSEDHGRTWTWADWKFSTSFGCPTFLNFGRNYAGARDGFVYIYSPDSDGAYEAADRMVLARVPRDQLRSRAGYEFFVKLDAQGQPVWSGDIAARGAVFTHPGCCYRSGLTYNAALRRYLWVQILPQSRHPQGPRFQGGFGVYDAPEPWGPWTSVYVTADWDVGPGETGSFPAKWMSADGQSLAYVFSGNDSFSVRGAKVVLVEGVGSLKR